MNDQGMVEEWSRNGLKDEMTAAPTNDFASGENSNPSTEKGEPRMKCYFWRD